MVGRSSTDGDPHIVCERDDVPLRGDHNVLNVLAACAITGASGVSADVMEATIRDFKPVPHRLEVVRVVNDVTYINDSIATAPERVVAALKSFSEPLVLLAGGKDKNLPWEEMIRLALSKCRHIVAFGDAGDLVVRCGKAGGGQHRCRDTRTNVGRSAGESRFSGTSRAMWFSSRRAGRATMPTSTSRRGANTFVNW